MFAFSRKKLMDKQAPLLTDGDIKIKNRNFVGAGIYQLLSINRRFGVLVKLYQRFCFSPEKKGPMA